MTDSFATIDAFMISHNNTSIGKNESGLLLVDYFSENLVSSYEKTSELYWNNAGTYVETKEPYTYRLKFANGHALFSPMLLNYTISSDLRSMEDDYGVLPYPKLDENQEKYLTHMLGRTGTFYLPINITEEKSEIIGYVIDTLSAYSYLYLRPAIYNIALTEKGIRDDASLEMLELIMENRRYDTSMFFEAGGAYPFSPFHGFREPLAAKKNITSFYESKVKTAQSYLDKINAIVAEQ